MNILSVLTAYPPAIGGAQLHTHQIMRQLQEHHRVQVVSMWDTRRTDWLLGTTLRAPLHPHSYLQDGIPVQQISLSLTQRAAIWPWVLGYYPIKRAAIWRIAALLAPQIDAAMPYADLVHCARIGREPLAFAALQVARARGVPFVLVPYHHPRWVGWNYHPLHDLYRAADAVLALTNIERNELAALGVQPERLFVIGAAPNLEVTGDGAAFRTRYGLGDAPIILFMGQKYRYKGWELLLQAAPLIWKQHPTVRFVFIGPPSKVSRQAFAAIHNSRILELGAVSEHEKADALAACTIFCLPSSQESFGMVYAEAWQMGRPVVGLDIPALREVIDDGVNGLRVASPSPDALAAALIQLLDDPARADAMGIAGRNKVERTFSWERVAAATEAAYRKTLVGRTHTHDQRG